MQYLGIDWGTRRASWCALDEHGALREGAIPADQDGLARLALTVGTDEEVRGCIEMMSGAVWVRDQLALVGWDVRLADARKVKSIAPLACKTDRVDARVLADLVRRDLVPEVAPDPSAHVGDEPQLRSAHAVGTAAQPHRAAQARRDHRARRARRPAGVASVDHHAAGSHRGPRPTARRP
jgi:transposase